MLKKANKKLVSFIILLVFIFGTIQPILAVSGTANFVAGQFASYMFTTDNQDTKYGITIRRIYNRSTKEWKTVFCSQHGVDIATGDVNVGTYYTPTDERIKYACKIAYFGWYDKYEDYVIDGNITAQAKKDYAYTQQFVWEYLGQSNATFVKASEQQEYLAYKNEITNKISNIQKQPSFSNNTIVMDIGETRILTDTNGVLANYTTIDKTIDGIRIVHYYGENTMSVTVNGDCVIEKLTITDEMMKEFGCFKEKTIDKDTTMYISFKEDVQDQIYSLNYNDPVALALKIEVNSFGKLELLKTNEKGELIDGAIFKVEGDNYSKEVNVTNGKITLDKLKKGKYTVTEVKAPAGYLLNNETYEVEVQVNQTTTQTIVNKQPTGIFTLVKKSADGSAALEGTKYRIWNNNGYDKEFTTDKNGKIVVDGLTLGKYNYKEIQATNGYLLDTKTYSFEFKYEDQYTNIVYANAERINETPTGTFTLTKTNADGTERIEGTKYKIWNNNGYEETFITDKNGKIIVNGLELGTYYYKEVQASNGYLLDDTTYSFKLEYQDQSTNIVNANAERTNQEPVRSIYSIEEKY